MPENIAVYVDATWNREKHRVSRNYSTDSKTRLRLGLPYIMEPIGELGQ